MAQQFNAQGFLMRFVFALLLVYVSYNPSGLSYFHWAKDAVFGDGTLLTPPFALVSVVLLIGWTIYLRATFRSLGGFGLLLALAFFAIIIWWLVDLGLLGFNNVSIFSYIVLFLIAAVLAVGMSWSHVRRRLSGQADMDDVDE
jgi:high-affinity Fe2+/Pb2+ permease